jgi:anti-anti-sigma factor
VRRIGGTEVEAMAAAGDNTGGDPSNPEGVLIAVQRRNGVTVITPKTEITYEKLPLVRDRLHEVLDQSTGKLVLDLEYASYLASAAITMILGLKSDANKREGDVRLCRVSETALHVFGMLGLDSVVRIYDSADEAVDSYGG